MAPKVIHFENPQYDVAARKLKIGGHVLVYLQVNASGIPDHLRIVRPLGAGLDEAAVKAVAHYRFKPAEEDGVPVRVEMNVDVQFEIF